MAYIVWQEQPTVIKFLLPGSPSLPFCPSSSLCTLLRCQGAQLTVIAYYPKGRELKADKSLDILFSVSHLLSTLAIKSESFVELSRRPVFTQGQICLGALGLVCLFLKLHS